MIMNPYLLRYLIMFAMEAYEGKEPPIGRGVGLAVAIAALQAVASVAVSHFIYNAMLSGGESRSSLISLVFEKSLLLSPRAKADGWGNGKITNLMGMDTYRIDEQQRERQNNQIGRASCRERV